MNSITENTHAINLDSIGFTAVDNDPFKRLITAKELKEKDDFKDANSWYIKDILPKGVGGLVVAPQKSFKSSSTLFMAHAIATGQPFGEHETTKANVLIIDNEDTEFTLHQRLNGYDGSLEGLYFLTGGVFKLDDKDHMNKLYSVIKQLNIKVVILDCLKDMISSPDALNDMHKMNELLMRITKLKLMFGDVTFLLVAHARKDCFDRSLEEPLFRTRSTHALGSSAIGAWHEVCFTLSPKISKKTGNKYSIIEVEARNFNYDKPICVGYVDDKFTIIDPTVKVEKGEDLEEGEATKFLDDLDKQGKVTLIND